MRPVHIAGIGQIPNVRGDTDHDEVQLVQAVASAALAEAGLHKDDIGFFCSGSSDYVMGRPFSFTMAIDGVGLWPPKRESHVEMDGAWALYEAWVRLQHGDVDTALVYAYGKGHGAPVDGMLTAQLDPYYEAPLGPSPMALAALQARALIDAGRLTERDLAEVVAHARRLGATHPGVPAIDGPLDVDALLDAPYVATPLRAHDEAVRTDGATAIVLSVGGGGPRIGGIAHCIEPIELGLRDLTAATSVRRAAAWAGLEQAGSIDVAELHATYSPQAVLLRQVLGLADAVVDPSGGALVADTPFVTGLSRIAEAARAVQGGAVRALAHASGGPCLQHNLICLLEAR
ncbi:MAG: lipid-transfer protein [Alphaproteobacteria bacterium]|nr:lipid-transfer protein [Alphaproteobacteria bacterium]